MPKAVQIATHWIGEGSPAFVVAKIGINHNGDLAIAKRLIDVAKEAGCNTVKFQKRNPEHCVPPEQRNVMRETPWGPMTYFEDRYKVEFDEAGYAEIDRYCQSKGMLWFASPWNESSVDFLENITPPCYKIPSDSLADFRYSGRRLLRKQAKGTNSCRKRLDLSNE